MKKILLAGSSGLIGREIIALASHYNIQLTALFRSTPQFDIDKSIHQVIISDWHNQDIMLDLMKDHDELICTIGTTIKKAGSQKAFEDTDIGIVTLLANNAFQLDYHGFHLVSSIGADASSSNFYLQCKGKAENAVLSHNFDAITILRPSLLLGNRIEFRFGEKIAMYVFKPFSWAFLGKYKRYKPIHASVIASCLLKRASSNEHLKITLESDAISSFQ